VRALKTSARIAAVIGVFAAVTACSGAAENSGIAQQCENGLKAGYKELDFANAKGFGGSVDWTKAAGLLSAASIQNEFGKYPNCVNKVKRARYYIEQSQK
jgi:hypothetical protein